MPVVCMYVCIKAYQCSVSKFFALSLSSRCCPSACLSEWVFVPPVPHLVRPASRQWPDKMQPNAGTVGRRSFRFMAISGASLGMGFSGWLTEAFARESYDLPFDRRKEILRIQSYFSLPRHDRELSGNVQSHNYPWFFFSILFLSFPLLR